MGKGKPVELKTTWGDKKTETFKVKAKTLLEVAELLDKREEWGKFEGHIPWDYETEGSYVSKITLSPWYNIQMPEWDGYNDAPKTCQDAWDKMWKKLEEHEDGHKDVHLEALAKVEKYVEKASNLTEKELKADMKKLVGSLQGLQDKFDTATDHGKKKGVYLDIADECK